MGQRLGGEAGGGRGGEGLEKGSDMVGAIVAVIILGSIAASCVGAAVSLGVAFDRNGGGGLRCLWNNPSGRSVVYSLVLLVSLALVPFAFPFAPDSTHRLLGWSVMAGVLLGMLVIVRGLPAGWSVVASIAVFALVVLVLGMSTLYAYKWSWQGLNIRDVSGIDQGDGFEIGLAMFVGWLATPLVGGAIGLLAQRGKLARA